MEALTAVAVAALTLYDMVKAVDKTMVIGDRLVRRRADGRAYEEVKVEVKVYSSVRVDI